MWQVIDSYARAHQLKKNAFNAGFKWNVIKRVVAETQTKRNISWSEMTGIWISCANTPILMKSVTFGILDWSYIFEFGGSYSPIGNG